MNKEKIDISSVDSGVYVKYITDKIKEVASKCGPRPVGGEGDKKARKFFERDVKEVCDETVTEEFRCSDKAFMSWVSIGAVTMIVAIALFVFGLPVVSLVLSLAVLFFIVSEFFFYKQTLDIFFRKKDTYNVVGKIRSSGETKKRIVLCGHIDSAFEWTYTYYGGRPAVATVIISAVITLVAAISGSITAIISNGPASLDCIFPADSKAVSVFGIILLCLIPFMIAAFFFCNFKKPVTGANDNLTGSYTTLAIAKYFKDNNIRFENTEIQFLLANGEEAGLRGSKDFVKRHKEELTDKSIETVAIAIDTIHDTDFMKIILGDMNGTVKNDNRVVNLIKSSGDNLGYDIDVGIIDLGSTDAASFSQIGVPAASFVAMDPTPARYYHTRLDTADILDENALEAGFRLILETVLQFDEKGI